MNLQINNERVNPFHSNGKTPRSPLKGDQRTLTAKENVPTEEERDVYICNDQTPCTSQEKTPQVVFNTVDSLAEKNSSTYNSPRQEFIIKMRLSEEESLTKCRSILERMKGAITRQRNINRDVQNGVIELDELLDIIADYRRNWKTAEEERESIKSNKALQICQDTPKMPVSRNKRTALSPAETNPEKKHKRKTNGNSTAAVPTKTQNEVAPETRRRKREQINPRPKRPKKRPDAVVIKPRDGHSYADVLKNLRSKVNPEETEVAIQSVRKTKSGSILLVMGQGGRKDKFREAIMSTLKEEATVLEMKSTATIQIQDLDSLTTEEEVFKAIKDVANTTEEDTNIRMTATNSREQKRAFVSLPTADANTLLEKQKILIGWTYCRIRYIEEVKRCYQCFESGHMQWDCKGPDRKSMGLCIRCGQKGHKMKECRNQLKCCVCSQSEGRPTDHLPGSRSCKPPQNGSK